MKNFHLTAWLYGIVFFGLLLVTTTVAYMRKSGNTRMDMGKVHLLRSKMISEN